MSDLDDVINHCFGHEMIYFIFFVMTLKANQSFFFDCLWSGNSQKSCLVSLEGRPKMMEFFWNSRGKTGGISLKIILNKGQEGFLLYFYEIFGVLNLNIFQNQLTLRITSHLRSYNFLII